ncbi:fumarylacetoacetate hydrolase family protein [Halosimplex halophilum]|uniref:fumarylacetoacetate hydrolase family protein n=1 Tax=Halosimplex halophilum TaxID=2559572 RepID=UPI00107F9F82|nr:fumarylacetoacetate hydrolase family protein [Halosimplex halophilum]
MRYFQTSDGRGRAVVVERDDELFDLSETEARIDSFREFARAAAIADRSLADLTAALCEEAPAVERAGVRSDLLMPVRPDEIWGAGVTYAISQEDRQAEGGLGETYLDAYEAERPEVYFKATPTRTVGPGEAVGIRGDSEWNVPEPELSLVLLDGEIVGYTVGNDMCSREIERENLLYLPQSKIYDRSCAVGPAVALVDDPHDLEMSMTIERDGETVFADSTSTGEMVRTCEELASYFRRHNYVPELTVLLTGTSIIPPTDVTLHEGDTVAITIEDIGTLENKVVEV